MDGKGYLELVGGIWGSRRGGELFLMEGVPVRISWGGS
jgi:hypothetical protein